jgi:hypothetical protein
MPAPFAKPVPAFLTVSAKSLGADCFKPSSTTSSAISLPNSFSNNSFVAFLP